MSRQTIEVRRCDRCSTLAPADNPIGWLEVTVLAEEGNLTYDYCSEPCVGRDRNRREGKPEPVNRRTSTRAAAPAPAPTPEPEETPANGKKSASVPA